MKLATLEEAELRQLVELVNGALDAERTIELHVVAQGWQFRCEGLGALLIHAYPQP